MSGDSADIDPARSSSQVATICVALAAVAIAMLIVALAPSPNAPIAITTVSQESPASNIVGTVARLDFTLKDINGVDVQLASFKGKVILVNFWATWCPPCRAEIPGLVELQAAHPDDVVVLGLLVQDPMSKRTQPFVSSMKMNYPVLDANDRPDIENAFGGPFWGIPASIVIGRNGRFASKHAGIATKEELEREIQRLQ